MTRVPGLSGIVGCATKNEETRQSSKVSPDDQGLAQPFGQPEVEYVEGLKEVPPSRSRAPVRQQQIAFLFQRSRVIRQACVLLAVSRSQVAHEAQLVAREATARTAEAPAQNRRYGQSLLEK
jgi:hypothetical protein